MKFKLGQLKRLIREVLEEQEESYKDYRAKIQSRPGDVVTQDKKEIGNDPWELEKINPEAFEALPESYKNDHALTFYIDVLGDLCADHDLGGTWVWSGTKWVEGDSGTYYNDR